MNKSPEEISQLQRWILAARPRTLPAAVAPVLVAWGLAIRYNAFRPDAALVLLLIALLLQINANLINDVIDYQKGLDTAERLGPLRMTQAGLLSPRQVWTGVAVVFALAGLAGLYLTLIAGLPVIIMGLAAFVGALAYSTGPFPLASKGVGELAVLAFFGFLAVCGSVFVMMGSVPALAWWCATAVGALTVNILVVNNLRDIDNDRKAGRRNIPVVFGYAGGEAEYIGMQVLAYVIPLLVWLSGLAGITILLPWLSLWYAFRLARAIHNRPQGRQFNPLLGSTAQLVLFYSLLMAVGVIFNF
ncbi:MAG: 1,4-dihydroxy-2-naphthoate polyprenyltransferase [Anaerolineae bacterium]|nr:1,4-dihydroxy-2-naphthoate polyprenyltransferase [Anaerolineae bacterium]